jgi:hypothetical protein
MKLFLIYSIILILFQLTNFTQSNENKQNNEKKNQLNRKHLDIIMNKIRHCKYIKQLFIELNTANIYLNFTLNIGLF